MDPYLILEIDRDAYDEQTVRKNYAEKIKRYPPHKHPELFARIELAYQTIGTERKRLEWEVKGRFQDEDSFISTACDSEWEINVEPLTIEQLRLIVFGDAE